MSVNNYYLLDDMERYNLDFDRSKYEDKNVEEIVEEFREFYSKRLPVDVTTWIRVNNPKDEMIYKQAFSDQVCFVRDAINHLFYENSDSGYEELKVNPVLVINTHTSKSIKLPVYKINLRKYKLSMIIRNNFHDWKLSIVSEQEINVDFMELFDETKTINSVYCEGFKEDQVFQSFKDNKKQFTVEIYDRNRLFTFMYLLNNYLKKDNPRKHAFSPIKC